MQFFQGDFVTTYFTHLETSKRAYLIVAEMIFMLLNEIVFQYDLKWKIEILPCLLLRVMCNIQISIIWLLIKGLFYFPWNTLYLEKEKARTKIELFDLMSYYNYLARSNDIYNLWHIQPLQFWKWKCNDDLSFSL